MTQNIDLLVRIYKWQIITLDSKIEQLMLVNPHAAPLIRIVFIKCLSVFVKQTRIY